MGKKIRLVCVALMMALLSACGMRVSASNYFTIDSQEQFTAEAKYSLEEIKQFSAEQCLEYIKAQNVEIPQDFQNMRQEELEDFVYKTVQNHISMIEEGTHHNCGSSYSYTVSTEFADAICNVLPHEE